jgi:predicted peptidase
MINRRVALAAAPLWLGACTHAPMTTEPTAPQEGQHGATWPLPGLDAPLRGWQYLPPGYTTSARPWPLVVFLHGSGERGVDAEKVKAHGPPKHAARGERYPFVLVSPQLPEGLRWEPSVLHALLARLKATLHVDAERVTCTGLSLGGMGAWDWATGYPQDLAGIAPVCGFGEPDDVCRMAHVPVRAYHGAVDDVVPLKWGQASVDALRTCGGQAELIVYPGVGHDAWNPAYDDPALVPWLMARVRTAR